MGKDITFTGRVYIWDAVILKFLNHPLLGYGLLPFVYVKRGIFPIYSTHNFFLDILYKTGITGMIYLYREKMVAKVLTTFVFGFSIMLLVEAYPFIYVFYLLVICYNCTSMIEGE